VAPKPCVERIKIDVDAPSDSKNSTAGNKAVSTYLVTSAIHAVASEKDQLPNGRSCE